MRSPCHTLTNTFVTSKNMAVGVIFMLSFSQRNCTIRSNWCWVEGPEQKLLEHKKVCCWMWFCNWVLIKCSTTLLREGSKEIGQSGARDSSTRFWNRRDYGSFPRLCKIAEFKDGVYKFSDMRDTVRTTIFQRRIRDFMVPRVLRFLSLLIILWTIRAWIGGGTSLEGCVARNLQTGSLTGRGDPG